jgi:hypothetical protein
VRPYYSRDGKNNRCRGGVTPPLLKMSLVKINKWSIDLVPMIMVHIIPKAKALLTEDGTWKSDSSMQVIFARLYLWYVLG